MKTQLYIGQTSLRGALAKYSSRFNLLEIRAEPGRLPRTTSLRRWKEEVPKGFAFSIMLSREVGRLGPNYESELELGLQAVNALQAKWIVLQTDPTIGPSQRTRLRLRSLFTQMSTEGTSIAWEPHGVWQEDEALTWTRDLGVHLVRDIFRGDTVSQDIVYSRMPGIGTSARMSAGALENAANCLSQASEGYVVIGGDAAGKAARVLRGLVQDEGRITDSGRSEPQVLEEFDELMTGDNIDEFDDDSEDEEPDSDVLGDDDEAESDTGDTDDTLQEDSLADDLDSDDVERDRDRRGLPKKGQGARRK